ncbi:nucleolar complex-associated protein [Apiospora kogelbergensis]|uniref:Nucleolar complex-associated protein 3 n=1 Tax=Apiospora kogelbergensis TaxID=1337665 RepID=A0AAW0QQC4_9PEZI
MASRPAKKRKLTPPPSDDDGRSNAKAQKAFFKNAASWDLEQDYETKARKAQAKVKESTRLPIKLADGRLQHMQATADDAADDAGSVVSDEDWLDASDASGVEDEAEEEEPEAPRIPVAQQIREAKEELAKIATLVQEDPEDNAGAFKALAKIGQSRVPAIQKLAMATQLSVYKDVIPGYRIRPQTEDGPKELVSKGVRTLRGYEQAMVAGYQGFIKELTKQAKLGRGEAVGKGQTVANVAITCACTLLNSVPHFNFRTDLVKILVGKLSTRRVDNDFEKCAASLIKLFEDDEEGRPAFEAVGLLSKMMRARDYQVDEIVLNQFLHLRLLSEFSGKASTDHVEHADGPRAKKLKNKKDIRSKKQKKLDKEQKALQKDMDQADAIVSHEERERMQSETLKLVFASYFRILKARVAHLMGATLEGLAKYAHLINQDFFGDILEALKDLIRSADAAENGEEEDEEEERFEATPRNTARESLLCTVTAFALLAGQDAHNSRGDLHLDLSFFTAHLYKALLSLSTHPDLELGAKSLHLPDPDAPSATAAKSRNKINLQTTTVLLIRSLTAILLPPWNIRSVPPLRLAAFTKQLMSASLHMPEKSAQAVLALLADVGGTHGRKVAALWDTEERKGDGVFNALSESVESSNPFATTVWEGELLRRHYCPKVREGVKIVEKAMLKER